MYLRLKNDKSDDAKMKEEKELKIFEKTSSDDLKMCDKILTDNISQMQKDVTLWTERKICKNI